MRLSLWFISLVLLSACAPAIDLSEPAAVANTEATPPPPVDSPLLRRVAVVGASASAGFGLEREAHGASLDLAKVLDVAILGAHETPVAHASAFLFMSPRQNSEAFVAAALRDEPTLVVALDFLFWFTYGMFPSADSRLRFLERGLGILNHFDCPVLTSEVPLMSEAVGKMLLPMQVPDADTLERANARIREWAAGRPNVHLVPMVRFLADLKAGRTVRLRDHEWPGGAVERLLQQDQLHPTAEGLAGLALLSLDTLVQAGALPVSAVNWEPEVVRAEALRRAGPAAGVAAPTPGVGVATSR